MQTIDELCLAYEISPLLPEGLYELGRVELVQEVIASMNSDPEDEEGGKTETAPESKS